MSENIPLIIKENAINTKYEIVRPDETEFIKCSNCDKNLIQIKTTKLSTTDFYKIAVKCGLCGDKSWEYKIYGKMAIHPCDGLQLTNIEYINDVMLYTTEKTK